jgi:hypothetical protein
MENLTVSFLIQTRSNTVNTKCLSLGFQRSLRLATPK